MNPCPYTVSPETPVSKVFNLFRTMGLRHLVVVNSSGEVSLKAIYFFPKLCFPSFLVLNDRSRHKINMISNKKVWNKIDMVDSLIPVQGHSVRCMSACACALLLCNCYIFHFTKLYSWSLANWDSLKRDFFFVDNWHAVLTIPVKDCVKYSC